MTFEVGDTVRFERDRGEIVTGTVTSVRGREPYRVIGVCGARVSENYLIPERSPAEVNLAAALTSRR